MRPLTCAAIVVGFLAWPVSAPAQIVTADQQIQLPSAPQLPGGVQIPPRDQSQQRTGTARLKGRIVGADSGSPLRRAQVRATAGEIQVTRNTTTDAEGRYEFNDLPAGRYSLNVSKGGYVTLSYGQRRPNEQGKPIELADGQVIEKVDMSLPRGSAISGRILDEFGEPVAGVTVQAMRYRFSNGQRRLVPASGSGSTTDDLGNYRVYGLAPGEYAISATLRGGVFMASGDSPADRSSFAPTYYPGTQQSAEAQRLTLGVGHDATNISFALIPSRAARISGTAFDSAGRPLVGQSISIRQEIVGPSPAGGTGTMVMMFSTAGSAVKPDGSFTLNNVAPGDYFVEARTRNTDEPELASVPVTVTGDDITGISLVTSKGATVRGQIVFDGGIPATVRPDAISVSQLSLDPSRSSMTGIQPPRTNDDWSFEMKGIAAGLRTFRVQRAPASWVVKSVMLNGNDITDKGYEFKGTEEVSGLQIVLTSLISEVVGTVTDPKGNPAREYTLVVFATDRDLWTIPQTRFTKLGRPDQEAKFRVRGLPAGEYYAVALEYLEAGEEGDPELLERLKTNAQRFSVGEGETKSLTVKLSPTS
jgi:carboxypeptidase family protein